MKTLAKVLVLFVSLAGGVVLAGDTKAEEGKKEAWKISGQLEEGCSCDAACPCWFGSKPTMMNCGGAQVVFIVRGTYGNVPLDGLAIANFSQSPDGETMMDSFGKWNFSYLYVDEKANAEQRKALEVIGRTILPMAASTKTEVRYVPITREIAAGVHKTAIGSYATLNGKLLDGGLGGTPKLVNPPGADPLHAEYQQGRASAFTYTDAGQHWKFSGTNYMLADFSLDSAQYEKYAAGLAQKMGAMKEGGEKK